jgi:hypothetical protein
MQWFELVLAELNRAGPGGDLKRDKMKHPAATTALWYFFNSSVLLQNVTFPVAWKLLLLFHYCGTLFSITRTLSPTACADFTVIIG